MRFAGLSLAAGAGCVYTNREYSANWLSFNLRLAAASRYEHSYRESAAEVEKLMQKQLGQRYADALAWRLEPRGSAHIGSLPPAGPSWEVPDPRHESYLRRRAPRMCPGDLSRMEWPACTEGGQPDPFLAPRSPVVVGAARSLRSAACQGGRHCDKSILVSAHVAARASAAKQQAAKTAPGLGKLSICRGERVSLGRAGHCHWPPLHPLGECGFARAGWLRCPLRLRLCQEQTCMFPWASGQMPPAGPSLVRAQSPGRPVGGFGGMPPASLSP